MAIFENFDQTTWIIMGLLAAAILGYYFMPESTKAQAEVHVDEATRQQAKSLIALASDGVDAQLFELNPMPLRIKAGAKLKDAAPLDPTEIREALWTQQRAMITRLEGELDYAQQADISEHFAIAAPANQPASLLQQTLKDMEATYARLRDMLKLEPSLQPWHGRALLLMLSTRKLFDHVAWLTGAGLAASAPGAFVVVEDDVVMMTLYATRLGHFQRPLTLQVSRAVVRGVGGEQTPAWLEYGLASWLTDQLLGKVALAEGEQPPVWSEEGIAIFDAERWKSAAQDSTKLEQLVRWSSLFADSAMSQSSDRILSDLRGLRADPQGRFAGIQDMARQIRPAS